VDQPSTARRWQAAADLIWTRFEDSDKWVVYHPSSCHAHLLTASAHLLWKLVADGQPHTLEQLAAALAADAGRPPDEELISVTRNTLDFMDRMGLVGPIRS
jgi:PqqD family protein of HPr-rel-A system